jgi:hypothetical protein
VNIGKMESDIFMPKTNELDSTCGISDDELTERFKEAIRIDNEIKKIKGVPIAGYDIEKKMAYLEYPDGRRKYAMSR